MAVAAPPAAKKSLVIVGGSIVGGLLLLLPLVGWWVCHVLKKRRAQRQQGELGEGRIEVLVTETVGTGMVGDGEAGVVERERGRKRQREVFELPAEEVYHAK